MPFGFDPRKIVLDNQLEKLSTLMNRKKKLKLIYVKKVTLKVV